MAPCSKVTEQMYLFMHTLALTPDTLDQILTFYRFFFLFLFQTITVRYFQYELAALLPAGIA